MKYFLLPEAFIKKESLDQPFASIEHVKELLAYQKDDELKIAPKLTTDSADPSHFKKMSVSEALALFNHATSAGLRYLSIDRGDSRYKTTAIFFDMARRWFDLATSRNRTLALSKGNLDAYEKAKADLKLFVNLVQTMAVGEKQSWKPYQSGIAFTTQSLLDISENLLNSGFEFVLLGRFTQDALENLFSLLR